MMEKYPVFQASVGSTVTYRDRDNSLIGHARKLSSTANMIDSEALIFQIRNLYRDQQ